MANQDAFVQFLLLDELLHVLGHNTIVVLWNMERLAMIAQILRICISFMNYDLFVALQLEEGPAYQCEDTTLQVSGQGSETYFSISSDQIGMLKRTC